MPAQTLWTNQNIAVLEQLERDGRFVARESFMRRSMEDVSEAMLFIYRWLARHMPTQAVRPQDARFPVWTAFSKGAVMKPGKGSATLELSVEEKYLCRIGITDWTSILNYAYLPEDEADRESHYRLLGTYGTDDAEAVMTPFYPQLKQGIMKSWERAFDNAERLPADRTYGLLWEVRKEWIRNIYR